jgi:hypothetical protein
LSVDIPATSDADLLPGAYNARAAAVPRLNLLPQLPIGVGIGVQGLIKPGLLVVSHGSSHHAGVGEPEGPCQVPVVLDPLRGESVVAGDIDDVVLGGRRGFHTLAHISRGPPRDPHSCRHGEVRLCRLHDNWLCIYLRN